MRKNSQMEISKHSRPPRLQLARTGAETRPYKCKIQNKKSGRGAGNYSGARLRSETGIELFSE